MRIELVSMLKIIRLMDYVNGSADDVSDDIIDEGELYNRLCAIISELDESFFSANDIQAAIDRQLRDYEGPKLDSKECLKKALNIMVTAAISSRLKQKADTLLNGLLARNPELKTLPRAGIVHRLDRDTSGLMVVAKTLEAQTDLIRQLQARTVKREYWAIVHGQAPEAGYIEEPIMRDPRSPMKFCVGRGPRAKEAKTHVRLVDTAFVPGAGQTPLTVSWVACRLDTGRTHQIRVHMQWAGLPLVGDPVYKGKMGKLSADSPLSVMKRQSLHASRLGLVHPETGEAMQWFVPAPDDFAQFMETLGFGPVDEPVTVFEK